MKESIIEKSYETAKEIYAELGVDTDIALEKLAKFSISIHCWQGDDVGGFETPDSVLEGGGIHVTGNYPGKARNIEELRTDLEKVFSLLPGKHRLNLHAIYGEFQGKKVDRNEIENKHFIGWIEWAQKQNIKLDFNATLFSHPLADSGFTLSHRDKKVRDFWIEHVKCARSIAAFMGQKLGSPCIHNLWIPDGYKDIPYDRLTPRKLLKNSLDQIFQEKHPAEYLKDSVESKLFGIGSESYVVGSHDFYLGYAIQNNIMVCLDMGHYHPTETIVDKITSIIPYVNEILLHISRGVRWDSDHIAILNDEIRQVAEEIVRNNLENNVHIALDFFDASVNRIGAYVIGVGTVLKSLLLALLEPQAKMKESEIQADYYRRLAYLEIIKTLPFGAVWNYYCHQANIPVGEQCVQEIKNYEKNVLTKRG